MDTYTKEKLGIVEKNNELYATAKTIKIVFKKNKWKLTDVYKFMDNEDYFPESVKERKQYEKSMNKKGRANIRSVNATQAYNHDENKLEAYKMVKCSELYSYIGGLKTEESMPLDYLKLLNQEQESEIDALKQTIKNSRNYNFTQKSLLTLINNLYHSLADLEHRYEKLKDHIVIIKDKSPFDDKTRFYKDKTGINYKEFEEWVKKSNNKLKNYETFNN